jgi:5,10-methylenetetrahydromethanopterin reductase
VPLEVAATGPRVIGIAARHADRVMFSLGAEAERLAWGIETARRARQVAGLDPDAITFGAYLNCACHRRVEVARETVRGGVTTHARFSVMHGEVAGPASVEERAVLAAVHDHYDMRAHTRSDSPQAAFVTPEFIDRFAIVGSPDECIGRFGRLAELGISKFVLSGVGNRDAGGIEARALFEKEVLPALVEAGEQTPRSSGN